MRILHFLSHSAIRGGPVVVSSLVRAARDMHQDMTFGVVLPEGGAYVNRFKDMGVETMILPLNRMTVSWSSIRKILRYFSPNIIHTHERSAGWHVRKRPITDMYVRVVHSFHGFNIPRWGIRRQATISMENHLAGNTDAFICVSESEGNEVHKNIGHARGKVHVIGNTIDPDETRSKADMQLPADVRAWFDANRTKKVITMIARPDPVKNYDLAFRSAAAVLAERPNYAFMFVGMSPTDPRVRKLQRRFGASVGATSGVPSAAPVIRRSWMLLLPSHREGSPLVILEGFALGVPTIGTRVPGIIDLLQDGWNGFLIDKQDRSLLEVLQRVEQNPDLYAAVQRGAKEQGSYLRPSSWAREYLGIYRTQAEALQRIM